MTDMIIKQSGNNNEYSCYIITVENPMPHEEKLVNAVKRLIDYNRQNGLQSNDRVTFPSQVLGNDRETLNMAIECLKRNQKNREMASELENTLLLEIEKGTDPYVLVCIAAEIISRLEDRGDAFEIKVSNAIDNIDKQKEGNK